MYKFIFQRDDGICYADTLYRMEMSYGITIAQYDVLLNVNNVKCTNVNGDTIYVLMPYTSKESAKDIVKNAFKTGEFNASEYSVLINPTVEDVNIIVNILNMQNSRKNTWSESIV